MTSINTNVGALLSLRYLREISSELTTTQNRISSGLRVSRVTDDASTFAVAAGLRADMSALQPYDFATRLASVRVPTLVLTAETEPLRASFEPMRQARGDCAAHVFPDDHPINVPTRRGEFARSILGFMGRSGA